VRERAVRVRGFGELEAVIMDRLWTRNAVSTVRDIFDDLSQDRRIAYTTVMSTMDNLHRKGILTRERVAQAYHYRPVMTREEYSATLMRASFDPRGDTDLVLTHFLEQMPAEESARVQDALRRIIFDGKQR
jgi:predicted transcriptional regulator